jgi:tetratricopeptide (TPR) repeat protein
VHDEDFVGALDVFRGRVSPCTDAGDSSCAARESGFNMRAMLRGSAAGLVVWIFFVIGSPVWAQDIDSASGPRGRNPATIADQIRDPAERAAFLSLYRPQNPADLHASAKAFLQNFPRSAYLAQANEVAARGSFDLGQYREGIEYARQSLRILPENPLLLVNVADVEARQRLNDAAIADGGDAIEYFGRFARPAAIAEGAWPDLKRNLEASAYFALGRAFLAKALNESGREESVALLERSQTALAKARELSPSDPEIIYLSGLAYLPAGHLMKAAGAFQEVNRSGGEFAPKALENLKAIYKQLPAPKPADFETFLRELEPAGATSERTAGKAALPAKQLSEYAGSESCRSCHGGIYRAWTESGMSKMFRPYAPQNVIGDFVKNNEFLVGEDAVYRDGRWQNVFAANRQLYARMVIRNGRHFFSIKQSDGKWHSYPVDYTIGSKWQQGYATKLPTGEIEVFPIQYNVLSKQWINFWKIIDDAGSVRTDPLNWEKFDPSTTYQTNCAVCHTSQLSDAGGSDHSASQRAFREPGIDCEMCHGPSARHISAMEDGTPYEKTALDPPVDFAKINSRDFIAVCSQCHMQSAIRAPGPQGELNYARAGEFFMRYASTPFGEFSRKGFYPDGRFRQTTFIVEAIERSQCFRKGQVTCANCHDPHSHDESTNLTSLKFRDDPDRMCTQCHSQLEDKSAAAQHTHHSAASEGSRCAFCHMPRIMDSMLFSARTHQIDDIPDFEMTLRFGQEESPNACLQCHADKDVHWLEREMRRWKPGASQ